MFCSAEHKYLYISVKDMWLIMIGSFQQELSSAILSMVLPIVEYTEFIIMIKGSLYTVERSVKLKIAQN